MRVARRGILQVIWVLIVVLGSCGEMLANDFYPYITTTFPIDGYVTNLIVPRRTPEYLFALVGSDGKPKPSDRPGLYCFDISNPARLRQVSYLPIVSPTDMQISPDGRTLFVFSAYFHGNDPKAWYGVRLLNVSDPARISEISRIETDVLHARLSVDGSYLFLQERGLTRKKDKDYFFSVYRVSSPASPQLATIVMAPSHSSAYGFYPTPDGKHLLIEVWNRGFVSYNIANPARPEQEFHISPHLGYPKAIGSNGVMYLTESDELILAKIFPKPAKLGGLSGNFSIVKVTHVNKDNSTIYVASLDKAIRVFDVSDPRTPRQVARYNTPAYIGSAVSRSGDPLIFVGLIGSIAVIDPSKATVTAERLVAAHKQALRFYSQSDTDLGFFRVDDAINVLEAAGIRNAASNKPAGLSSKVLAGILNDYGFFLEKADRVKDASEIYKQVIQLDPSRKVAYLNLGDSLRKQLPDTNSFQDKIALTREIRNAYSRYKNLHGKPQSSVDSFLALNVLDKPIKCLCEYVAAYASRGRLKEIFGSGRSVVRSNGGTMRIEIPYQGRLQIPSVVLIDNETNEEILNSSELDTAEGKDDYDWCDAISIVPFSDGNHLVYYNEGGYLISSTPVGKSRKTARDCRFTVHVEESVEPTGANAALCRIINSPEHPPYISLDKPHKLEHATIQNAGYDETSSSNAGRVDFDNDGTADLLASLNFESGSGRGCSYSFFDLLNREGNGFSTSRKRALLLAMQGVERNSTWRYFVPRCSGNIAGWFRYKGITYFETRYPDNQPGNTEQEFHSVSYIKDGKIKKACESRFRIRVEVQR